MAVEEDWILFLEKNPHFYELTKGDFFIQFLEKIYEGAKSFSDIKALFPQIEEDDLKVIMDVFLKLKIVVVMKIGSKFFFSMTEDGKKLLFAYRKTAQFYRT